MVADTIDIAGGSGSLQHSECDAVGIGVPRPQLVRLAEQRAGGAAIDHRSSTCARPRGGQPIGTARPGAVGGSEAPYQARHAPSTTTRPPRRRRQGSAAIDTLLAEEVVGVMTERRANPMTLRWTLPVTCLAAALLVASAAAALADPWKDESGHGRGREGRDGPRVVIPAPPPLPHHGPPPAYGYGPPPPGRYAEPRIPPGHLPPPGECRWWFPDRPAGHQPPLGRC